MVMLAVSPVVHSWPQPPLSVSQRSMNGCGRKAKTLITVNAMAMAQTSAISE